MKVQYRIVSRIVLGGALILAGVRATKADSVYVSYLESAVQTPVGITSNYATFDGIVPLTETSPSSALEPENQAAGTLSSHPAGTQVLFTPEPGSLSLLAVSAILTAIGLIRRRKTR